MSDNEAQMQKKMLQGTDEQPRARYPSRVAKSILSCRDPENMLPKEVETFEFKINEENKIICTQISIWKVLGHL